MNEVCTNYMAYLKDILADYPRGENLKYILEEEAQIVLQELKNNKALGLDLLFN